MQTIEYHPITKLILNGDTSPINEDEQKYDLPLKRFSNPHIAHEISKNKIQRRKKSIQIFTDELITWNNYLHHKFQHSDQVSHRNDSMTVDNIICLCLNIYTQTQKLLANNIQRIYRYKS